MALREGLNQLMGVETMSYPHLPPTPAPQPAFSSVMNVVHVAAGTRRPPLPRLDRINEQRIRLKSDNFERLKHSPAAPESYLLWPH
jgi:hypothetical protein